MPKYLSFIAIFCLLIYSCSKEKKPTPNQANNIKISVVSGNNQTAATAYALTDSITVKVTSNGAPLANCIVEFTGSGCNSDLSVQLYTKADGTVKYSWRLAADIGNQTLNAVAINNGKRADSVMVLANATAQSGAQSVGACSPYHQYATNICQLTTGRLIANFYGGPSSLRYSDDAGFSWYPLKSFGAGHLNLVITTTSNDEIFVACGDGIFYSPNAGNTWTDITPASYKTYGASDIAYTKSGKLIATGLSIVYVSSDKGKTWTSSSNGIQANRSCFLPAELNNGDIYVWGDNSILYKSTDKGLTWLAQNDVNVNYITAICVDNNGWFYKSVYTNSTTGPSTDIIYQSKDNGLTFTPLISAIGDPLTMAVLSDGILYYSNYTMLYGLIPQFPTPQIVVDPIDVNVFNRSYLISQNNLFYINNGFIMMEHPWWIPASH